MAEEADAAEAFKDVEVDPDEEMPVWAEYIVQAWQALSHDRFRSDMGSCSGIYYGSISRYAEDHALSGDGFHDFYRLIRAVDDEYVTYTGEQAKAAMDKAKQERDSKT